MCIFNNKLLYPAGIFSCIKCHRASDTDHWAVVKPDSPPFNAHYEWMYEPILLLQHRSDLPRCVLTEENRYDVAYFSHSLHRFDDRFCGYGFDRTLHTLQMALEVSVQRSFICEVRRDQCRITTSWCCLVPMRCISSIRHAIGETSPSRTRSRW